MSTNVSETETRLSLGRDIWVISDEIMRLDYTINLAIVCFILSVFGMVTNVINVVVFLRLGFAETINISLMGLAVSDFFSLVTLLWVSICYNPFFMYSDLPVDTEALQHYPGAWTHVVFTRVTGFITVFITLERCLCIAFPLKVKLIMTRPRVMAVIVGIYVLVLASMVHNYFASYIGWKWEPELNRTIIGITYTSIADKLNLVSWHIQLIYPIFTYVSVVACTFVFVWKLSRRGKWLQSATGKQETTTTAATATATRDQQVIKMVVAVAVIFIVCYVPSVFIFLAMIVEPRLNVGKKYENMFIFLCSITFPMEAFNSSVNIFVYYNMMSKYKAVFRSLWRKPKKAT